MMKKKLAVALMAIYSVGAFAEEYSLEADVDKAVLYYDSAMISRHLSVSIDKPGRHQIVVSNPLSSDISSIRPKISGATLRQVSLAANWSSEDSDLTQRITEVQKQLNDVKHAINMNEQMSSKLAASLENEGVLAEVNANIDALTKTHSALVGQREDLYRQLARLEAEQEWVGNELQVAQALVFDVFSEQAGEIEMSWQEQTHQASWQPRSHWSLDSEANKIDIDAIAEITQQSGVDWQEVSLSLAITPPGYADEPGMYPWTVSAYDPEEAGVNYATPAPQPKAMMAADAVMESRTRTAVAVQQGVDYRIDLPGTYTLTSSQNQQQVPYWQYKAEAEVYSAFYDWMYYTDKALLMAKWTMPEGPSLIPGQMSLYRDGVRVAELYQDELISAGYEQRNSFGFDPEIEVKQITPPEYTDSRGFISKSNAIAKEVTFELSNRGQKDKPVRLYSRVPVSTQEIVSVEAHFSPQPDQRDVEEVKGLMLWQKDLGAGETWTVESGFEVEYPKEKSLQGL
ncbi:DUF4139 domain-containing protein [Suttonella sp. R2A3]|uniref:DUF4139 domain-containing protein n=1 Tax=Suttonella sp. R2A3 TaxID=2908648 RepID=UPI001F30D82C|nr:DUF4139 domain-containing protein [Suttonella sp. R2A3]UJF24489.1 DUF4139 domain-containing protein [Suttonella sp. R2A3]